MKNKSASLEFSFVPRPAARSRAALGTTVVEDTPDVSGYEVGTQFAYVTNSLNQYSGIATPGEATFQSLVENTSERNFDQSDRNVASPLTFSPTYDADGNATLVRTSTGTWQITYNGENRPIRFENAATQSVVECAYDYRGRRCTKKVTVAGTLTQHERGDVQK